jgi:PhzF family phenazine biosynthesis protein
MKLNISIVDAFTTKHFSGNQAAVIPLDHWLPIEVMQNIAIENNLSETAFVVCNSAGVFEIRWFSPIKEIDFCGHATLASAYVIFSRSENLSKISFLAKAVGTLTAQKLENGLIEMAFPNREPIEISEVPRTLSEGLSIAPVAYLKNQQAYFAVFAEEEKVKSIVPDLEKLKTLAPLDVVVTAPSKEFDFTSRYFWPANGGAEDPVTGSIHAGLAPYWAKQLNKNSLVGFQASKRTGVVYCRVEESTVFVSGKCVSYLEGTINI